MKDDRPLKEIVKCGSSNKRLAETPIDAEERKESSLGRVEATCDLR
jgi:hypothetical protein